MRCKQNLRYLEKKEDVTEVLQTILDFEGKTLLDSLNIYIMADESNNIPDIETLLIENISVLEILKGISRVTALIDSIEFEIWPTPKHFWDALTSYPEADKISNLIAMNIKDSIQTYMNENGNNYPSQVTWNSYLDYLGTQSYSETLYPLEVTLSQVEYLRVWQVAEIRRKRKLNFLNTITSYENASKKIKRATTKKASCSSSMSTSAQILNTYMSSTIADTPNQHVPVESWLDSQLLDDNSDSEEILLNAARETGVLSQSITFYDQKNKEETCFTYPATASSTEYLTIQVANWNEVKHLTAKDVWTKRNAVYKICMNPTKNPIAHKAWKVLKRELQKEGKISEGLSKTKKKIQQWRS